MGELRRAVYPQVGDEESENGLASSYNLLQLGHLFYDGYPQAK